VFNLNVKLIKYVTFSIGKGMNEKTKEHYHEKWIRISDIAIILNKDL